MSRTDPRTPFKRSAGGGPRAVRRKEAAELRSRAGSAPGGAAGTPGEALRSLRARLGLTRRDFAELMLCSERTLATYEDSEGPLPAAALTRRRELAEFADLVAEVMPAESVPAWLRTEAPDLGGMTPLAAIREGRIHRLTRLLLAHIHGVS